MDEAAKGTVKEIVKHLGGKYTLHMTRQNTHLVLERATGAKFHAASAYGVIPITPEWLVASADAGKMPLLSVSLVHAPRTFEQLTKAEDDSMCILTSVHEAGKC